MHKWLYMHITQYIKIQLKLQGFVCLFAHVVQSWLTTVGPDGLDSPRSPFSTPKGDWDLYFLKCRTVEEKFKD